LITLLAIWCDL